eukprot:14317007-Heterocapsa_arctica.AAC.1
MPPFPKPPPVLELPRQREAAVGQPGRTALAVPVLPAWPRLRFERPFPEASEGKPGCRNPCGHPLAAGARAELSKCCGLTGLDS